VTFVHKPVPTIPLEVIVSFSCVGLCHKRSVNIRKPEGRLAILFDLVEGCSARLISRTISRQSAPPLEAREDKFANGNVEDRKNGH
jgi:hypothetical protein